MQPLRHCPLRNDVPGPGRIRRRIGDHGKSRRGPLAQKDIYRVVGRQLRPGRRGLLQDGVLGDTVENVRHAAEA